MELDDLARAVIAGDQRAWTQLYRALHRRLRSYFEGRIGRSPELDDLIQNTLAAVSAKLHTFEDRGESAFMRWVYGFAWIELQAALRRRRRHDARVDALAQEPTPSRTGVTSQIDRAQRLELIRELAKLLPDAQRRAIENDLAGGDAGSLAAQEQLGRGSARMLQSRARRRLRVLVRERMAKGRPASRSPSSPLR